jgi:uncharacterized LabA/DUF88 family protein
MVKVKVFVDYSNFRGQWKTSPRTDGHVMKWAALPKVLAPRIRTSLADRALEIDFRGVNVYASVDRERESDSTDHAETENYLRRTLDQKHGYTVKIFQRDHVDGRCPNGHTVGYRPERGVDTKIVCDLMALAMRGHYDVAVLLTNDSDMIPAVEAVQDILDRQVFHLGFGGDGQDLRSACWSHILLDDLLKDIAAPPQSPRNALGAVL